MKEILMGAGLDFLVGDPYSFPHPVRLMGKIISLQENIARKISNRQASLKLMGLIIVIINVLLGFFIPFLLLKALSSYTYLYVIVKIYLIYTCLAAKSLHYEAIEVKKALNKSLDSARKRVSHIVGRETEKLSREEIIKATVETIAENTSDGVIAPLFFIMIFGPAAGICYKFINTMDSMLGYMDEKYKSIGYFPAKTDDLVNFLPARLSSLLMVLSSIGKFDFKRGIKITLRDGKRHNSPNSGYPESSVAGLLGIELGGNSFYHGILIKKSTIGDGIERVNPSHIHKAIKIMYRSEIFFLLMYVLLVAIAKSL